MDNVAMIEQDHERFGKEGIRILRTGYILVGLTIFLTRLGDSNEANSQDLTLDSQGMCLATINMPRAGTEPW